MVVKRIAAAGAGLALLLGGAALVFDSLAGEPQNVAGSSRSPGSAAESPGAAATGSPAQAPTAAGSGSRSGDDAAPQAEGPGGNRPLEVLPPVTAGPTGLPMPPQLAALVDAPLPNTASATGKTVEGFPSGVISFPDGTVVVFTGISSHDTTLQATAEGIVESGTDKVLGHFQQILQPAGFLFEAAPAVAGQQGMRFVRGKDTVSVTLSATGTGSTRFSLLSNLHTDPEL